MWSEDAFLFADTDEQITLAAATAEDGPARKAFKQSIVAAQNSLQGAMRYDDPRSMLRGRHLGVYVFQDTKTGVFSVSQVFAAVLGESNFTDPLSGLGQGQFSATPPHPRNSIIRRLLGDNRVIKALVIRQFRDDLVGLSARYQDWAIKIGGQI